MIEFKQIIGRGTRLFDGKDYFTIYDFVRACEHFNDPEWDGEPVELVPPRPGGGDEGEGPTPPTGEEAKMLRQARPEKAPPLARYLHRRFRAIAARTGNYRPD
jgi:hypothetical protein